MASVTSSRSTAAPAGALRRGVTWEASAFVVMRTSIGRDDETVAFRRKDALRSRCDDTVPSRRKEQ
ncbi:hypothetical protein SAVCW2_28390 [Streptomyces avermitilis]|uniref:Uncharacterized protein n=1 Tax=Streptomyces avermitilis TaxID=33903 RepID=A0A499VU67_STRAX|nr:hypothetical protein SAVMC3_58100 [Streptomyces avermitilis]GDY83640.1 hypothetical protein SAVCW2_28390 [Streptomyces avermitilis]